MVVYGGMRFLISRLCYVFFFFSSRRRHTRCSRDWSSDVCSSDLATWVSIHHGGGVGMGFSQHAGMVIVCDGTAAAARRIARVLWNDPASGVMRHADAGYEDALACAREHALDLPSIPQLV